MNTYNFFDLYVYFILVAIFYVTFIAKATDKQKSTFCYVILLFFTIFRYNVGWDYDEYVETIMTGQISLDDSRYEPFSRIILFLANKLQFYPIAFILFGTIHLTILKFVIDRMSISPVYSWFLYLLMPFFFLQDLATIRQACGVQCVLLVFYFLLRRQYVKAVVSYISAIMFHYSTLYGIFLFPLALIRLPNTLNWLFFISSFFAGNVILSIIGNLSADTYQASKLMMYVELDNQKTSLLNYLYYIINMFFLLFYKKIQKIDDRTSKYIQISNFGVCSFNMFLFEPTMSTRFCTLYSISWIFVIPYVPLLLQKWIRPYNNNISSYNNFARISLNKNLYSFIVLIPFVALLFFHLMLYVNAYNNHILYKVSFIPYDFWWNHI